MTQYFAKYRGKVENNIDPLNQGRLQVSVPAVLGTGRLSWAMPCVPYAGPGVGLFAIPPKGANVWVEFEAGNADAAIWSGCFWALGEPPQLPALAQFKVLKTDAVTITITDVPNVGIVTIETALGMKLVLSPDGLELTNGQGGSIKMTGPQVSVNQGALEVT